MDEDCAGSLAVRIISDKQVRRKGHRLKLLTVDLGDKENKTPSFL